jgi:hypothetical protein
LERVLRFRIAIALAALLGAVSSLYSAANAQIGASGRAVQLAAKR